MLAPAPEPRNTLDPPVLPSVKSLISEAPAPPAVDKQFPPLIQISFPVGIVTSPFKYVFKIESLPKVTEFEPLPCAL